MLNNSWYAAFPLEMLLDMAGNPSQCTIETAGRSRAETDLSRLAIELGDTKRELEQFAYVLPEALGVVYLGGEYRRGDNVSSTGANSEIYHELAEVEHRQPERGTPRAAR